MVNTVTYIMVITIKERKLCFNRYVWEKNMSINTVEKIKHTSFNAALAIYLLYLWDGKTLT